MLIIHTIPELILDKQLEKAINGIQHLADNNGEELVKVITIEKKMFKRTVKIELFTELNSHDLFALGALFGQLLYS